MRPITLGNRVLLAILDKFGARRFFQVDTGFVGDEHKIKQHIGAFVAQRFVSG